LHIFYNYFCAVELALADTLLVESDGGGGGLPITLINEKFIVIATTKQAKASFFI